jgi:hypothetical protein
MLHANITYISIGCAIFFSGRKQIESDDVGNSDCRKPLTAESLELLMISFVPSSKGFIFWVCDDFELSYQQEYFPHRFRFSCSCAARTLSPML